MRKSTETTSYTDGLHRIPTPWVLTVELRSILFSIRPINSNFYLGTVQSDRRVWRTLGIRPWHDAARPRRATRREHPSVSDIR